MTLSAESAVARLDPDLVAVLRATIEAIPIDFAGGSGLAKAATVADLIRAHGATSFVEIGVYRGRSLLPVAAAMRWFGTGVATGIDPWGAAEAHQRDIDRFPAEAGAINSFVADLDWDLIHAQVGAAAAEMGLAAHCRLIRARSDAVAQRFAARSVDILHIDGNHDEDQVLLDLARYLPKVRHGGFVILDDFSWDTVRAARDLLERIPGADLVTESRVEDFGVYRVP